MYLTVLSSCRFEETAASPIGGNLRKELALQSRMSFTLKLAACSFCTLGVPVGCRVAFQNLPLVLKRSDKESSLRTAAGMSYQPLDAEEGGTKVSLSRSP